MAGLATGKRRMSRWRRRAEFGVEYTALGADEAEQLVRDVEADVAQRH
ncbi:hypothetical protein [Humibacter ginsenosidimutans]|nr:hypothetical protein [Humibacter ginsenosidimutans]